MLASANANQNQHKIVEEDSRDYEDDEYLSQSGEEDENLVKRREDSDDEEIDVEKLDFQERALLARINSLKRYLPQKYQNLNKKRDGGDTVKSF